MPWTVTVVLIAFWLLGRATSYTLSGLIHVLLFVANRVATFNVIQGRRV